jgi:hypothetical protein
MGCAAEEASEEGVSLSVYDEGWYFLRRDVSIRGNRYRAGTLVEHLHGEWFVQNAACDTAVPVRCAVVIDASMICRTSYGSVALYEVWRVRDDLVYARPVLSHVSPQSVDPMMLNVVLASGQSRVCVRFGRCFLPLELFNW